MIIIKNVYKYFKYIDISYFNILHFNKIFFLMFIQWHFTLKFLINRNGIVHMTKINIKNKKFVITDFVVITLRYKLL